MGRSGWRLPAPGVGVGLGWAWVFGLGGRGYVAWVGVGVSGLVVVSLIAVERLDRVYFSLFGGVRGDDASVCVCVTAYVNILVSVCRRWGKYLVSLDWSRLCEGRPKGKGQRSLGKDLGLWTLSDTSLTSHNTKSGKTIEKPAERPAGRGPPLASCHPPGED